MSYSRSDQTGVKHQLVPPNPPVNKVNTAIQEKYNSDTKWQKFWPKHSSTSETFFRYNAKPSLNEVKKDNQNIPEHIVTTCGKGDKSNLSAHVLTLYLEKEKYENKLRPKVSYLFTTM